MTGKQPMAQLRTLLPQAACSQAPACLSISLALLGASLGAQDQIINLPGGIQFGAAVANAGDLDQDGINDIVVGAPGDSYPINGTVTAYSGKDGRELWTISDGVNSVLGRSLDGIGDVNNDGVPDVVAGGNLFARCLSGRDGSTIANLTSPIVPAPSDNFGDCVRGVGDLDGDGIQEVAVGAPRTVPGRNSYVQVFDGASLNSMAGPQPFFSTPSSGILLSSFGGDSFGIAISGPIDVDGDGSLEVVVGAPTTAMAGVMGVGRIVIYDNTGVPISTIFGTAAAEQLGYAVDNAGPLGLPGSDDILVGSPGDSGDLGAVRIFSGLGTNPILATYPGTAPGGRFGRTAIRVGDVNGDGATDFAASAPLADAGGVDSGSVVVISGATGLALTTVNGAGVDDRFGLGLAALGDVNEDGIPDVAGGPLNVSSAPAALGYLNVISGAPLTMWSDTHTLPLALGGTQNLSIGVPAMLSGQTYWIFASATGRSPGTPVGNGIVIPLVSDSFTSAVIGATNTPMFSSFLGLLAAPIGPGMPATALASVNLLPSTSTVGLTVYFAGLIYDPSTGTNLLATNGVSLYVAP